MNQPESILSEQYLRCGRKSTNALKSLLIFGGGFVLTFLVYMIVYHLINPGYAAIAAIVTMLASLFALNYTSKYSLTEFEYKVFRGEFEITRIQGRTNRKNYITFSAQNVLLLTPYSKETLAALELPYTKKLDATSFTRYEDCWLVVVDIGLGKNVVVLIEPTEETLNLMRYYLNPVKIRERAQGGGGQ